MLPGVSQPGSMIMRYSPKFLAKTLVRVLPPPPFVGPIVISLLRLAAATMSPRRALKLLFRVDQAIYRMEGVVAQRLGEGVHLKHRLTGYHQFFIDRIAIGDRVLDIGCGDGTLAAAVAAATGADVVGIDHNRQRIAVARERHRRPNLRFEEGDASGPLPQGPYDVVMLSNVLEHIDDREALLKRLLTAGAGRLLIRVPTFDRDWRVPARKELGEEWRLDEDHRIEYTQAGFREELACAGFDIAEEIIRWGEIWADARPAVAISAKATPRAGCSAAARPTSVSADL